MSLREVATPRLPFEQIVSEEMTAPLAVHGFRPEQPSDSDKDTLVLFLRVREDQEERVVFSRRFYDADEAQADLTDDVERALDEDGELWWASRHYLSVQFWSNCRTSNLLTGGQVGSSETGEEWWHFEDGNDLRRVLRGLLPLILREGLRYFEDSLEDLFGSRRRKHALQENVA